MNPLKQPSARTTVLLVHRARQGDESARTALYERCAPRLKEWAHRRIPPKLRGPRETDDLVQDVLGEFLAKPDQVKLRDDGAILGYLRSAVWSRIYHLIKSDEGKTEHIPLDADAATALSSAGATPTQELINLEAVEKYEAALATLSERERTAVILRIDLKLGIGEIAEAMEFSSWASAQRFAHRSVLKVAKLLGPVTDGSIPMVDP